MDHTRDNPLKRFSAFWVAILMIGLFGIACIILRPLTHSKLETAYMMKEEERLKTRAEIEKAQMMDPAKISSGIDQLSKSLGGAPTPGAMNATK